MEKKPESIANMEKKWFNKLETIANMEKKWFNKPESIANMQKKPKTIANMQKNGSINLKALLNGCSLSLLHYLLHLFFAF